jgi:hypothetical protein
VAQTQCKFEAEWQIYENILMRTALMRFYCESFGYEAGMLKMAVNPQKRST